MAEVYSQAQRSTIRFGERAGDTDVAPIPGPMGDEFRFLIRRVLRGGSASPGLVNWVRNQVPELPADGPSPRLVDQLARKLSHVLLASGRMRDGFEAAVSA